MTVMNNVLLQTTSLQTPNIKKNKIFYLGGWCLEHKDINHETIFLKYPYDDRELIGIHSRYIYNLYHKILNSIYLQLNILHNVNYSKRYWDIVLRNSLYYILESFYEKWTCIKTLARYKHSFFTEIYPIKLEKVMYNGSEELISAHLLDVKNYKKQKSLLDHYIYGEIIKNYSNIKFKIVNKDNKILSFSSKYKEVKKKNYLDKFFLYTSKIIFFFKKEYKFLFLDTLNLKFVLDICLKNKIFLTKVEEPELFTADYKKEMREWSLNIKSSNEFENFVDKTIPKILPKSLVEGYSKNCFNIKKKILARFKILFAYPSTCDVRNIFIAQQVESGSKIANFQHGGGYGQAKVYPHEVNEIEISDYFFTWGWSNYVYKKKKDIKKIVKFFPVNIFNKKVNYKKNDKILLVLDNFAYNFNYFRSNPISLQARFYLDRIKKFISNLDVNLKKKLIVRCYPHNHGVYDFYNLLKKTFKDIEIEDGSCNILRLYKKAKCCVFAQNSTAYLESVNLNIPTIIFWDDNFYEIRSSFKLFMTKHSKNKFYHKTSAGAANFLNANYEILEKWWSNLNQKKYFKSFVSNYLNQDVERSKKRLTNFIKKITY